MTLSIITINYNNRDGLQKTIDSVLSQTWTDFEWLVIDGGSTDGSKELIEKYQKHFTYWCSEPDRGVYHAMNKGINHARGEYLLFLNSGDCLYGPTVLQQFSDIPKDADLISGQVIRSDNGELLRKYDTDIVKLLIKDTLNHQGTFIHQKLFDHYRYNENYKIVSDWIAWIDWIIKDGCSYKMVDTIIATQDTQGVSICHNEIVIEERKLALVELYGKRLGTDLLNTYDQIEIPSVKRLLFLSEHSKLLFVFCRRIIYLSFRLFKILH
jgi:glycosyltransferase involved in cell wall biosynthesis